MYMSAAPSSDGQLSSVLIVDDHPLFSDALAFTLKMGFEKCDIHTARSLSETLEILESGVEPDLIMLDLKLPDVTGISGFEKLRSRKTDANILVISSLASAELVQSLLDRGAMGFLPKESSASTLCNAVREIASGRRYIPKEYRGAAGQDARAREDRLGVYCADPQLARLTRQQRRILRLICAGKANKQIAYEMSLAEATVKAHISALLRRLGVRNRTQAAVLVENLAAQQGGGEPEVQAFLKN